MRMRIGFTMASLLLFGCPAGFQNLCDNGACDTDASINDSGGPDAPPGCDLSKDPKDSPACVADSVGIFVDATSGKDTNAGTKSSPLKTILSALSKAGVSHPRLYLCEGTFLEDVILDSTHDGISLYGGWKCDWSYSGVKPKLGKTQNAFAIKGLTKAIVLEDVAIQAADGTLGSPSSIALFINGSASVIGTRISLTAGAGMKGDNGTVAAFTYPPQSSLIGANASGMIGGTATTVVCPNGQSTTGGKGGDNGFDGDAGLPTIGDGGTGGKLGQPCAGPGTGGDGSNAPVGSDAAAITILGSLTITGWLATSGGNGADGSPGQGGGGGQGSGGGGGGGGGCGGCGGAKGTGGTGGGGSVALAVLSSIVVLNASVLTTSDGGAGGNGVAGQVAQTSGGSHGNSTGNGCVGGAGGSGGNGGSGGGGAGGISVGILWKGTQPTADTSTTQAITVAPAGGAKGVGGTPGVNDGITGVSQAILQSP